MSAAVAELADALDSKSSGAHTPYRFDSDQRHRNKSVSPSILYEQEDS